MSEKLLPCPFCGGEATLTTWPVYEAGRPYSPEAARKQHYAQCLVCATQQGASSHDSAEEAIAAWNRRAPEPEPKPLGLEELRDRVGKPIFCDRGRYGDWCLLTNDCDGDISLITPREINELKINRILGYGWRFYDRQPKEGT